ncbi:MAG: cold shock domain-containing protein, partial [Gemmataceae bacterium]|nr:cold shock domain-containing protein [Gemmataceae bacterium]
HEIHLENSAGPGFIDYRCTVTTLNRLVVEAKKDSRDLGVAADKSGQFFKLNGPVFKTADAQEGIEQAIRYCGHKNAELACVTNGRQWIIFRGNRLGDGQDTLEGRACAFGSLEQVQKNFALFYKLLSYDDVAKYLYRVEFQTQENHPPRRSNFVRTLRRPEGRQLLPVDKLLADIDRIMVSFFRNLTGDAYPNLILECFVPSSESERAEVRLARISEDLVSQIQSLNMTDGQELAQAILRVKETQKNEFVLLVGTKGAGKTTFTDRFFKLVLPKNLLRQCAVVRVDLADSGCDERTVTQWLDRHLLEVAEKTIYPNGLDYDHLRGMYFYEYQRWSEGTYRPLYESDKTAFKIKFGEHVERRREERPHDHITLMLQRLVKSDRKIPCLVFDNADHFTIEFQEKVFQYAHSIYQNVLCLVVVPITDKTSWQLSRQGALQSFYVESFFLPAPTPKSVLIKRIDFINKKVAAEEKPESSTGYFSSRGIPLTIENIQGFAACLQEVFIRTEGVGDWIGNLANYDIRRALELTREVVSSPHIGVHELLKAFVTKNDALSIDRECILRAIVRGKYDLYPLGQHKFVQNLFAITTELDTTPLLGIRLLKHLDDVKFQSVEGEFRYVEVAVVLEFFADLGIPESVTSLWLDTMLKCGLCLNYDPTNNSISQAVKIEISPSGHQHLAWAIAELVYIDAMMEVTPIRNSECFTQMEAALSRNARASRLRAIQLFIEQLLAEDVRYCQIPAAEKYAAQQLLGDGLRKFAADLLIRPRSTQESKTYGLTLGEVVHWDATGGYGFLRVDGYSRDVFLHVNSIDTRIAGCVGERFDVDVVEEAKGLRAVRAVRVE